MPGSFATLRISAAGSNANARSFDSDAEVRRVLAQDDTVTGWCAASSLREDRVGDGWDSFVFTLLPGNNSRWREYHLNVSSRQLGT